MKKLLVGSLFVACSSAFAGHGPAGCGAGSEYIFPHADEWYEHVMAATTNGSASQTMAMTSGTMGCQDANGPLKLARLYMDKNMEQLAADAARGQGEALNALSALIGVQSADKAEFDATVKANFDAIFAAADTTSAQSYDALVKAMSENATLVKYLG
ncbi:MAG: DUF3015 family protein [Oceanospirillaceae bacterium]|nr:DUF3015 family protein [Oceanospirillaceae bacterium]MCP5335778.1 DUF3015 family protein [Oceanospirillaceae bacterium]MCP5349930.1 DUF3015 family protein [Oceanospirillaceae bacterium]